jgi:hypothetical protein
MSEIQPVQQRSILARIFLSPDEPRLRAGWRLLIQTLLLFVFAIGFGALISIIAALLGQFRDGFGLILEQILSFLAITGSVYVARRWLDNALLKALACGWTNTPCSISLPASPSHSCKWASSTCSCSDSAG